jgi:hypothetical protein
LQRIVSTAKVRKLNGEPEQRPSLSLEFHRWGSTPEGVTEGRTIYAGSFTDPRRDAARLHCLCDEIARRLGDRLPEEARTMLRAGRLYRRSADYLKACEYFLKVLELVHGSRRAGRGPCV